MASDSRQHPFSRRFDGGLEIADRSKPARRKALEEILLRYGRATVEQAIERIFDQTEASCRAVVADLPDGVYEAQSPFAGSPLDRNQPVEIKVRVIIHGSDMTIDLTECSPQRHAPINARTLAAP